MPEILYALSVDPGENIGWALWSWDRWRKLEAPIKTGVFSRIGSKQWLDSLTVTHKRFQRYSKQNLPFAAIRKVLVEEPYYAEGGASLAAAKSGALVKLSISAGWLLGYFSSHGMKVQLVKVQSWKGQLSKEMVKVRIEKKLGFKAVKSIRSHAWDAVGIGLYCKGFFDELR